MEKNYDFCGWATKNNIRCSDGRTIRKDAFIANNGKTVPLVWQHQHDDPVNVLGHALLENRPEGVFCYGYFNNSPMGEHAKTLVDHGDINALSIYANQLKQSGGDVLHGSIREVSLVLAGANPGASIIAHSDDGDLESEEFYIFTDEEIMVHSAIESEVEKGDKLSHTDEDTESKEEKDEEEEEDMADSEKTIKDVIDSMTDEQKNAMYFIIGQALEDAGIETNDDEEEEEEAEDMKHNLFDNYYEDEEVLTHSDMQGIIKRAKEPTVGTFQSALQMFADENDIELRHDAISSGFTQGEVSTLFPEYKEVRPGAPELITNDQGWVNTVLSKVHKSPISRIRTTFTDIRNIESLRAKGYTKGKNKKQTGDFSLVRRTTDPQTIYVKSALHRDDIVDITDFDYVQYLYNIDKMNLNEDLATAIMIGDSRDDSDDDKIRPDHIRPIWTDDALYAIHVDVDVAAMKTKIQGSETASYFGDNYVYAEAIIETLTDARVNFKGTGTPDMFIAQSVLNKILLSRDRNGRRIFSSKAELASTLNVNNIIPVQKFDGLVRTDSDSKKHNLLAICVNMDDYSLGSTKGGEVTHFTDFDIDFNQQKSLLETRCSGALTRVYSAIVLEEPVA